MSARTGPLDYLSRWPLRAWLTAVALFLYTPLIALMIFSFNDSRSTVVFRGFTLRHYASLANNHDLIAAFGNSLTIALVSTAFSVILGALTALLLWRFRFPFNGLKGRLARS